MRGASLARHHLPQVREQKEKGDHAGRVATQTKVHFVADAAVASPFWHICLHDMEDGMTCKGSIKDDSASHSILGVGVRGIVVRRHLLSSSFFSS